MKSNNTFSDDLERALLGALIIDPIYMPDVMNIITSELAFTSPLHAKIFAEIKSMYNAGVSVDLYTLSTRFASREDRLAVAQLTNSVGSGANSVDHAHALNSLYATRRLEALGMELVAKIHKQDATPDVISQWVQSSLDDILGITAGSTAPQHIKNVINDSIASAEERQKAHNEGRPTGITTGLFVLDNTTGGFRGGQLVILAGRPGMGKTALLLHLARSASSAGTRVVIFSQEMRAVELGDRALLGVSKVESQHFKTGNISSEEWSALESAANEVRRDNIYICDESNISIQAIKSKCLQLKNRGKCGMVMIDYLQLLNMSTQGRGGNREQEVSEATRQAKILAGELDVPVILLSQLSREVEKRGNKTPILSDLRESGSIEQNADMVIFIHRPAMYGEKYISTKWGNIESEGIGIITVAKQRNGNTGRIYFTHSKDLNYIDNYIR